MTKCSGVNQDGKNCNRLVREGEEFCHEHTEAWRKMDVTVRCANCAVGQGCPKYLAAPKGICWFELYNEHLPLDTRPEVIKQMELVIHKELILFDRTDREQKAMVVNDEEGRYPKLAKIMLDAGDQVIRHMGELAKFRGIEDMSAVKKETERKLASLDNIFGEKKKKKAKKKPGELMAPAELEGE